MSVELITDFQRDKLIHKFQLLDIDDNGLLEQADYEHVITHLAEVRGWSPDQASFTRLKERNLNLWNALQSFCDANSDGRVTLDEWLDYHANAVFYEREFGCAIPGFDSTLEAIADFFAELLDSDGDGQICAADYRDFCAAQELPEDRVVEDFQALDRDGDGILTRQEVVALIREFYLSNDPGAPGNRFFGSLG